MKSIFTVLSFVIFYAINVVAQENKKYWTDSKLNWSDFQERYDDKHTSSLSYFIGYNIETEKVKDTIARIIKFYSFIDQNLSWVNPAYKTDKSLRYNQVIFDIVKLHERKMQYSIQRVSSIYGVEYKFQEIYKECDQMISEFKKESFSGVELQVIEKYEKWLNEDLSKQPPSLIPKFEKGNLAFGFNFGVGYFMLNNSLKSNFTNSISGHFGFEIAHKKSILILDGSFGRGKIKKESSIYNTWIDDKRAEIFLANACFGYNFIDKQKFRLVPFAGICATEFSEKDDNKKDNEDLSKKIANVNYMLGMYCDYKLLKIINLMPINYQPKSYSEYNVRSKISLARSNLYPNIKGMMVNFSVAFSFGNAVIKWVE